MCLESFDNDCFYDREASWCKECYDGFHANTEEECPRQEKHKGWFIYIFRESGSDFYKIGQTVDIQSRMSTLATGNPHRLFLVKINKVESKKLCYDIELHVKNEWRGFLVRNNCEWYDLDERNLECVKRYIDSVSSPYACNLLLDQYAD